ncbi:WecB/TagA/CpsF family glycosyltransferase [Lactobacillus terrae]|uniref:WecB/TagA/CpsF family glycosyltransferase n=1 Tax=Lactobacillus terrae TaxID=2269374 RepID=UPI000C1B67EA|nr:WecB/TagA/CpsF family glycosyltransferase [Lactobacillus terrae]
MHNNKVNILGTYFDNFTVESFHQQLIDDIKNKNNRFIVTPNPEIVLNARDDKNFQNIINQNADYVIPDGIGIIKGANKLGTPLPERITGFDTTMFLIEEANKQGLKLYILGSTNEVITASANRIKSEFSNVKLVGYNDGYFKDEQKIVDEIKEKQPDIVLVALGSPKQEIFINNHRDVSDAIWIGIGGSFDVFSGTKKRAPKLIQKLGLEWFYRFAIEPSRFIRMLAIPKYLRLINQENKKNM